MESDEKCKFLLAMFEIHTVLLEAMMLAAQ